MTLPTGLKTDVKDWRSELFKLNINDLRDLPKHKDTTLDFSLSIVKGHPKFNLPNNLDHKGLLIPRQLVSYYNDRRAPEEHKFTLQVQVDTDIDKISKSYSVPTDIYEDIVFSLCLYLNAALNILTYARISPVILDDEKIIFNEKLAYLLSPSQDWFNSYETLTILLNYSLKNRINSTAKHYEKILPHVRQSIEPLDLNELSNLSNVNTRVINYIHRFSRVLSEIIRMHPSHDFSAIIGLLTALIEGFLLINGKNRCKFKMKVSNLLNDDKLGCALTNIYDTRSNFFHSAKYKKLTDVFHFLTIEFLLGVIKKIIKYQITSEIKKSSFDYKIKSDKYE